VSPCVSVVIPSYNRAALVVEAVGTVLSQEVKDIEVLIVDDGSTDATEGVVRAFGPRVHYIRQDNQGPAAARNTGIRIARAPLIAFLDSDDLWMPGKLRRQLYLLDRNPSVNLVFSGTETRTADLGHILSTYQPTEAQRGDAFREILAECFVKTSSVVIRREVLERVGLFNPVLFGPEDWELFARVLSCSRIDYVREPCVLYRKHCGSIQLNIERWVANDLRAMQLIFSLPRAKPFRRLLRYHRHRIYFEAGVHYFYRGDHKRASGYLWRGLQHGGSWAALFYLLKCALPPSVLATRRLRRQIIGETAA
jgi:glycosyltransferase involved in cell wall biosynthesis